MTLGNREAAPAPDLTALPSFLSAANARVRSRLEGSPTNLPDAEAVFHELDRVSEWVLRHLEEGEALPREAPTLLGARLLELLRDEVIGSWSGEADGSEPYPLFQVVQAFQQVRECMAPPADDLLGGPALDPWARELLGEVAHTLGSSFGAMVFLTEVLAEGQSGEVNELQRRQLRILHRAALTVGSTSGDILRLTRPTGEPESGEAGEVARVVEVLEEVADAIRPLVEEKELRLAVETPSAELAVDRPLALKRVLMNGAIAVIKVVHEGRVVLGASEETSGRIAFLVRGRGEVSDADRAALVQAFPPRPEGRGWSFSTSGLGAAWARRLLRSLGSDLTVDVSTDGVELAFSLPPSHRIT